MTELKYTFDSEGKNIVGVVSFGNPANKHDDFIVAFLLESGGVIKPKMVTFTYPEKQFAVIPEFATEVIMKGKTIREAINVFKKIEPTITEQKLDHMASMSAIRELKFDAGQFLTGIAKAKDGSTVTYDFMTHDVKNAQKTYSLSLRIPAALNDKRNTSKQCESSKIITYIEDKLMWGGTFEESLTVTCEVPSKGSISFWAYVALVLMILFFLGALATGNATTLLAVMMMSKR